MAKHLTIAGGGLAGLGCGVGLRLRGVPVELHEASHYPRHRVCGEFISGVTDQTLANLGIEGCFEGASVLKSMTWFRRGRCLLKAKLPIPARGISRHLLDRRLRDAFVAAGGNLHEGSRLKDEPREGLVWCAGRERGPSRFIGLKAHFSGMRLQDDLEMHLGSGGYLGLCRIEEDCVNACGLFPAARVRGKGGSGALLAAVEATGMGGALVERMRSAHLQPGSAVGVAGFRLGWQKAGILRGPRIGDAMAMIPPFTGNGMSMALEAAQIAVQDLAAFAEGNCRWEQCATSLQHNLQKTFRRRMLLSGLLHPFLTHGAGQVLLSVCAGFLPLGRLISALRS